MGDAGDPIAYAAAMSLAAESRWGSLRLVGVIADDIRLAHSVFALPFAVLGAFLAWPAETAWRQFAAQLALIVVCMVGARTWAMLVNRLVDRQWDAANPRTAGRALPTGRLTVRQGWTAAIISAMLFVLGAAGFHVLFDNPWPARLSAPVLAWIAFYSLTKRYTAWCHVCLGMALGASPIAAAIAIDPASLVHVPALWLIACMVVVWVAGFDVVYALQDLAFDRSVGLRSMPAALGARGAIAVARLLHALALGILAAAWYLEPRFAWLFGAGVLVVATLLLIEHVVLAWRGDAGLHAAFFTINGVVSCVLGAAGCLDVVLV